MKDRKFLVTSTLAVAAIAAAAWLFAQNRELRKEVASLRAKRMTAEIRRPRAQKNIFKLLRTSSLNLSCRKLQQ